MVLALSDMMFEPDESWRSSAACAGADDALFFPLGDDDALGNEAKSICAACPVSEACLQYALSTNQTEGVWGGMTGAERRRLRRRLRDRERRAS
jgi:WhiB family redox-sensing transcriptional regulator